MSRDLSLLFGLNVRAGDFHDHGDLYVLLSLHLHMKRKMMKILERRIRVNLLESLV